MRGEHCEKKHWGRLVSQIFVKPSRSLPASYILYEAEDEPQLGASPREPEKREKGRKATEKAMVMPPRSGVPCL